MTIVDMNHPVVPLLAFIDSEFDEEHVQALRELVSGLAVARAEWVLGPPQFVDETDDAGIRTVGILHHVYSAFDDAGRLLDEEIDRTQLEEVQALVDGLQRLGRRTGVDVGLELDGGSVGWVEHGEITEDLRVGLLEAWAARFG